MPPKAGKKRGSDNGVAPVFARGMKKKELERSGGFGNTVWIKKGDTVPLQFYQTPDEFVTFKEHSWEEDHKWYYVPCTGAECALCDDESDERRKTRYAFGAQVYNVKEKKAQVLKGGKDLGGRVFYRYERKPAMFTKRVLEVTKFATQPVSFEVSPGDDKPVDLSKIAPLDLEDWLQESLKAYYGDDVPASSALDDDEENEDEPKPDPDDEDDEVPSDDDDEPKAEDEDEEKPSGKKLVKCPECGKKLDEDGDCLNPKCSWLAEDEPEPKPKAKAAAGKK